MKRESNISLLVAQYLDAYNSIEVEMSYAIKALQQYELDATLFASDPRGMLAEWENRKQSQLPTLISAQGGTVNVEKWQDIAKLDIAQGSIAVLNLSGVMRSEGGMCHFGMDELANQFLAAYQNPNIEGIILKASTGGGESAAGSRLQAIIQDAPKPVVVYTDTMLASAGVRGAVTATEIIAAQGAEIGSIGTYITLPKGFSEQYNAYYTDVYADKSGNKNKSFRAFIAGDMSEMKAEVNRINEQFLTEVSSFRALKGSKTQQEYTLSGAMFSADEALRRGLVDAVGSFQMAIDRTRALASERRKFA
jgi:ClpP class serine protease